MRFLRYAIRQTDKQTNRHADTLITVLRTPGRSNYQQNHKGPTEADVDEEE